jgi:hypothetical protein
MGGLRHRQLSPPTLEQRGENPHRLIEAEDGSRRRRGRSHTLDASFDTLINPMGYIQLVHAVLLRAQNRRISSKRFLIADIDQGGFWCVDALGNALEPGDASHGVISCPFCLGG